MIPGRLVSPLFAGREAELDLLLEGFERLHEGGGSTVVIGGVAGGGKTRLVREYVARVRDRGWVLHGGCVAVGSGGLPYAPFLTALRGLVRAWAPGSLAELVDEQTLGDLGRLVPELGRPGDDGGPELGRTRLFGALARLVEMLSAGPLGVRPVVLVVEDLHWADAATRDLVAFLVRTLGEVPAQVVVTYRTDEVHDQHPVRPLLTELGRLESTVPVRLPPLTVEEVAAQLEGMLGRAPDPAVVAAVHERGGGVPLFTETLVTASGSLRREIPGELRESLLGPVMDLPEPSRRILELAALGGSAVSHPLLRRATGLSDEALTDALRPAVAAGVLLPERDGYTFRHDLIREAVEQELLPGERARIHHAHATALAADPGLLPGRWVHVALARHWRGAGDAGRALEAAWVAAQQAPQVGSIGWAHGVRQEMLQQVLDLWDSVVEPAGLTGADRAEVVDQAADAACWNGDTERGMALVEAGLRELDGDRDRDRIASLLLERSSMRQQAMVPGLVADLREAVRLAGPAGLVRAEALGQLARSLLELGRTDDAAPLVKELTGLSGRLGSAEYAVEARIAAAQLRLVAGSDVEGDLVACLRDAVGLGSGRLELLARTALADTHRVRGRLARAVAAGEEASERMGALGLGRYGSVTVTRPHADCLVAAGRWSEALQHVEAGLMLAPPPQGRALLQMVRAEVAIGRGDAATASQALVDAAKAAAAPERAARLRHQRLQLGLASLTGSSDLADRAADATTALLAGPPDPALDAASQWWALASTVARVVVDRGGTVPDGLAAAAASALRIGEEHEACALLVAAEVARGEGHAADWAGVADRWQALGWAWPTAYAYLRSAGALAAAGDRDAASEEARRAAAVARPLGARPLLDGVALLSTRARLKDVAGAGSRRDAPAAVASRLTARELEVLRLVTDGRSNRDIGAALFISTKTASVHVSNILAKLGVASRGEAAAAAHRLHLFEPT